MTVDDLVKYYYTRKIEKFFEGRPEVVKFVLRHPKLESCRDSLVHHIKLTELNRGKLLNADKIKRLAEDFGMMFADVIIKHREHEIKSETEKLLLRQKQAERDYIMDALTPQKEIDDPLDATRDS